MARAQREWERSLDKSTPVEWVPARGLVAYSFDSDLAPQVAVLHEAKNARPRSAQRNEVNAGDRAWRPAGSGRRRVSTARPSCSSAAISPGSTATVRDGALGANDPTVTYDDGYTMAAWIHPTAPDGAIVTRDEDIVEPNGHGLNLRGRDRVRLRDQVGRRGIRLHAKIVTLNEWHHVALTYTGSRWASGVKIRRRRDQPLEIPRRCEQPGSGQAEPLRIGAGGGPDNRFRGLDDVRIYNRALSAAETGMLADLTPVTAIAGLPEDERTPAQADKIRDYFLEHALPASLAEAGRGERRPGARQLLSKPSHGHGHGGNAHPARDARADPRDVRPAR